MRAAVAAVAMAWEGYGNLSSTSRKKKVKEMIRTLALKKQDDLIIDVFYLAFRQGVRLSDSDFTVGISSCANHQRL